MAAVMLDVDNATAAKVESIDEMTRLSEALSHGTVGSARDIILAKGTDGYSQQDHDTYLRMIEDEVVEHLNEIDLAASGDDGGGFDSESKLRIITMINKILNADSECKPSDLIQAEIETQPS
jgi:hypothetical protein